MGAFPGSSNSPNTATVYGPLPDHGKGPLKVVLHTTETKGMPGFSGGDVAPHYVYDATHKTWVMWAEPSEGRVGTMKGHQTNHCNCDSIQVEILGYSDPSHEPWVGHFDDEDYLELARFLKWCIDEYNVGTDVTPTPAGGWRYGTTSPHRLSEPEWYAFSGLTVHGAAPGNTHWDTGVLDLKRIRDLAVDGDIPEPPDPGGDVDYRTVKNVPDANWARNVVDRTLCLGLIAEGDGSDWEKPLKNGTIWNYLYRYTDAIKRDKIDGC